MGTNSAKHQPPENRLILEVAHHFELKPRQCTYILATLCHGKLAHVTRLFCKVLCNSLASKTNDSWCIWTSTHSPSGYAPKGLMHRNPIHLDAMRKLIHMPDVCTLAFVIAS